MKADSLTAVALTATSRSVKQICIDAGITFSGPVYQIQVMAANTSDGSAREPFNVSVAGAADGSSPWFYDLLVQSGDIGRVQIYSAGLVPVVVIPYVNDTSGPLPAWA